MRSLRPFLAPLLVLLAVVALGVESAGTPHAHTSADPAFFNQEHDLTTLATSRSGAPVPATVPAVSPLLVVAALVAAVAARPFATPRRHGDSRAPPALPA
jgi:hypothetical protein